MIFGFRMFTSQKLEALYMNNEKFIIMRGCKGLFIETWVLTNRPRVEFDEALMDQYHHLCSTDVTDARRHFPRVSTNTVLGSLRGMMSDHDKKTLAARPCPASICH